MNGRSLTYTIADNDDKRTYGGWIIAGWFCVLPLLCVIAPLERYIPVLATAIVLLCAVVLGTLHGTFSVPRPNAVDRWAAAYLLWGGGSLLIINPYPIDPVWVYGWLALVLLYLYVRQMRGRDNILLIVALLVSGAVQSCVGSAQKLDWLASYHASYDLTGTFLNPGPFGGYMAVCLIAGLGLWRQSRSWDRTLRSLYIVALILMGGMVILSASRAAYLGVLAGLVYYGCRHPAVRAWMGPACRRIAVACCLLAGIAVVACGLYLWRPASGDGRLLIWRVALGMIGARPLAGHGVTSFAPAYMDYQGAYFHKHPDSRWAMLADNNEYAFNEWLHVGAEQGIIGMLLAAGLWIAAFRRCPPGGTGRIYAASLLALTVFAFFSYPASVLPTKVLFPLLFGALAAGRRTTEPKPLKVEWRYAIIGLCLIAMGSAGYSWHRQAKAFRLLYDRKPAIVLGADPIFMRLYLSQLFDAGNYTAYIQAASRPGLPLRSYTLVYDMGTAYWQIGRVAEATDCYRRAADMVPNRVMPLYALLQLYESADDKRGAENVAREILSKPYPVVGSKVLEARAAARKYLKYPKP